MEVTDSYKEWADMKIRKLQAELRMEAIEKDVLIATVLRHERTIDRHLELLKANIEHHLMFGECLFCTMLELEEGHEHDPDCELAEAIDASR